MHTETMLLPEWQRNTKVDLPQIGDFISSTHQKRLLDLLITASGETDYQIKYDVKLSPTDRRSLSHTGAKLSYIVSIIALDFIDRDLVIGDERPDLINVMDELIRLIDGTFTFQSPETRMLSLSRLPQVIDTADEFVSQYYNQPKLGFFQSLFNRVKA